VVGFFLVLVGAPKLVDGNQSRQLVACEFSETIGSARSRDSEGILDSARALNHGVHLSSAPGGRREAARRMSQFARRKPPRLS